MPNYLRAFVPGGTFFFTVVTENRAPILTTDLARPLLREAVESVRRDRPFEIDAFVLLPDHLHTIWRLPEDDADFSSRWSIIKRTFAQMWLDAGGGEQPVSRSRDRNRRLGVWQRRFHEHFVRHDEYSALVDYAHFNPVKHGLCRCPHDWAWSSFHRWVAAGRLRPDWQCACDGPAEPPPLPRSIDAME